MGTQLGYAGLGTSGAPNTKSVAGRPDIAGADSTVYKARNNGIKIIKRRAKTKTRVRNPIV